VLLIPMMLLGIAIAMVRRSSNTVLSSNTVVEGPRTDAPMRLLRWATGLLSAQRSEWGQAMLGELGSIEGRGRRWRFTIGCVGAALLLPPWERAGAGVLAMFALAMGGLGLYASVIVRYGLGSKSLVGVAIVSTFLLSFALAALVLLRRPGIAVPGLLGGLFAALVWLAASGFTFFNLIDRVWPAWALPVLLIAVPAVIGVLGTLRGGSAAAGRRTARLAGISAGLGVYLYGTLAVAVLGAGGPPDDSGFSAHYKIDDRLGNNLIFYLAFLPLVTATIGWSAAAVTARIRQLPDDADATHPPATSYVSSATAYVPLPMLYDTEPTVRGGVAAWPRSARAGLVSVAVAGMFALAFATGLRG
jgi:hypothetical protein